MIQQSLPDRRATRPDRSTCSCPTGCSASPGDLVAFRWDGGWEQIPVQVDERDVIDLNGPTRRPPDLLRPLLQQPAERRAIHPEFTDSGTFVGPDSNATLDANDEIALMAFDAGGPRATPCSPTGVDPARGGGRDLRPARRRLGYAYLFKDHERARSRRRQGLRRLRVQPHQRSLQDRCTTRPTRRRATG